MLRTPFLALFSSVVHWRSGLFIQAEEMCAAMSDKDGYKSANTIYEFSAKDIDGNTVSLDKYKSFVLLIVNGACKCGYTAGHYTQLEQLYKKYKDDGLRIALFPSNQFGSQEPWPEPEIKDFVQKEFGITFDLYSKIDVNGDNAHPLYKFLKLKQGGTLIDAIKWNFTKFLIDRNGVPIGRWAMTTDPKSIEKDIADALGVQPKP